MFVDRGEIRLAIEKGMQAQQWASLFVDEAGFYPLPSVVSTYAPIGQLPTWWRGRVGAHPCPISAISPEGRLSFHSQDRAINSEAGVAFMVSLWDGAPTHYPQVIKQCLAKGIGQQLF